MVNSILFLTKPLKVKGSIVAMIAGTKAESVIAVIEQIPLKTKSGYRDHLRYGSKHGINCQKNVSLMPTSDRIHVKS
jgi:hypothetical protein